MVSSARVDKLLDIWGTRLSFWHFTGKARGGGNDDEEAASHPAWPAFYTQASLMIAFDVGDLLCLAGLDDREGFRGLQYDRSCQMLASFPGTSTGYR